ncbi:hypothetical protein [Vulcaniibacterium gelatinicum]|uniref:hypothetical protein n=1 Tax=Vulcaniibacterium gelatinicum TaxID=2598725 RepID=UPI0011CCA7A3|nr:hypothetical protein [Vulcaniibacterium gelatinicum]
MRWISLPVVIVVALAGCRGEGGKPPPAAGATPQDPPPQATVSPLRDLAEHTPQYLLGITFPPSVTLPPGLAEALRRHAEAERARLLAAVARKPPQQQGPYDLTLVFRVRHASPRFVVVAADGSRYVGGEASEPLIARFVWLPGEGRMLTVAELVPGAAGWEAIARLVRLELVAAFARRLAYDKVPPEQREALLKTARTEIETLVRPTPQAFAHFEPVFGPGERILALRFVFPPLRVEGYADAVQTAEVPAAVLWPHLAPAYRGWFEAGAPAAER